MLTVNEACDGADGEDGAELGVLDGSRDLHLEAASRVVLFRRLRNVPAAQQTPSLEGEFFALPVGWGVEGIFHVLTRPSTEVWRP